MRRWATLVVLLACCCAAAAGTEAGGRSTALLPGLRKALRTKLAVKAGLAAASSGGARRKAAGLRMRRGTLFRCSFEGEPTLHIKDAEGGYYLHRFTAAECTGGQLPSGRCFSALHRTYHCGEDEQWGLVSPAEAEGPAVTWYNHSPCPRGLAKVTADFWCPDREDEVELHQCMFDGRPEKLTAAAGADDACTGPGRYRHAFHARECFNGLPKPGRLCAVSLRRMEHCGGDHDWAASNNSLPSVPGMAWFTSHTCDAATVAADYFCPDDAKHRLHRCTYQGPGEPDDSCMLARVRHANYPTRGQCLRHRFREQDCTGGLPPRGAMCVAALKEIAQCGQEQDFRVVAPDEGSPAVRWWNTDPCGDARVVVDYYCPQT